MKNQAVHIVDQIGQRDFRFGALDPDRADDQTVAVLLMGEDMLNLGPDGGLLGIRLLFSPGEWWVESSLTRFGSSVQHL